MRLSAIDALGIVLSYFRSFVARAAPVVVALIFYVVLIGALICPSAKQFFLLTSSALIRVVLRLGQPVCQVEQVLGYANRAQ